MTEKTQEPHVEEDDDELDGKLNYKPPPQKTLQELQELDKDDESLAKYKKSLLGDGPVVVGRLGHAGRDWGDGARWPQRRGRFFSPGTCTASAGGLGMGRRRGARKGGGEDALSIRCEVTRGCWHRKGTGGGTCVGLAGLLRG